MVDPSPPSSDKAALRRAARARRTAFVAELGPDGRAAGEQAIAEALAPLIAATATLGAYAAYGDEPDLGPTLAQARGYVAFPHFADGEERFVFRLGPLGPPGRHGICAPAHDALEIVPALVLVPLVAIDAEGQRLGQGGGHYDRVLPDLAEAGARLVGVGWSCQRLDTLLPAEPHDVPLDGFVSEKGLTWY